MLEMLDAAQRHDALPLRRAPAERLLGFVRRIHVRVERDLSARPFRSLAGLACIRGIGRCVRGRRGLGRTRGSGRIHARFGISGIKVRLFPME